MDRTYESTEKWTTQDIKRVARDGLECDELGDEDVGKVLCKIHNTFIEAYAMLITLLLDFGLEGIPEPYILSIKSGEHKNEASLEFGSWQLSIVSSPCMESPSEDCITVRLQNTDTKDILKDKTWKTEEFEEEMWDDDQILHFVESLMWAIQDYEEKKQ